MRRLASGTDGSPKCRYSMGSTRVYIGNLDFEANSRDVERFFDGYGRITDVKVKKGFAFVEFENTKYAEDAIRHLDQKKLLGRTVKVEFAKAAMCSLIRRHSRSRSRSREYGLNLPSAPAAITNDLLSDDGSILEKERRFGIVMVPMKDLGSERIKDVLIPKATVPILIPTENGPNLPQSKCSFVDGLLIFRCRSSGSRSPRPRLKLGLVERIRLREALKEHQFEDGEVLSEIEELNLNRRLKSRSSSPVAEQEPQSPTTTSETVKVGSIETTPEAKSEIETIKESKIVIECPISEEEGDFTEDETTTEKVSTRIEEDPTLTDPVEPKDDASPSERELSVEV
ncbi:hypothetical protein FO519_007450 [Halicephalobus sp. NKZ332]|nr:hypothetical protein FO519_007450 [Halicephalobus sp. NKZ332]